MAHGAVNRLIRSVVLTLTVSAFAGCINPLNPESGYWAPKDPGTLTLRVQDEVGKPVANAWVYVTQPNDVGSEFKTGAQTNAAGSRTFPYVTSGDRAVEVKAPAGYDYSAEGPKQVARVVKGETTTVTFTLVRQIP